MQPVNHISFSDAVLYDAKTDHVREKIRMTRYADRQSIRDLMVLERFALEQLEDPADAIELRELIRRYPEDAAAIYAEIEAKPIEAFHDSTRQMRLTALREWWTEKIERQSWMRAGGLE